jgi:uncharacterized LabA/DUF88 family protein
LLTRRHGGLGVRGRTYVFIDFWNFQLNWNERLQAKCDWERLPTVLVREADRVVNQIEDSGGSSGLHLAETRLYASVDPHNEKEGPLKGWLDNTVRRMTSYHVEIRERRRQRASLFCRNCHQATGRCPRCAEPFVRSVEKGVDSAIVTDMLLIGWQGSMDVVLVVSSDADLVPAVRALRDHGLRTVNASWRGHGHELAKACWGSFDLDDIAGKVIRR